MVKYLQIKREVFMMIKGVLVHPDEFDETWISLAAKKGYKHLSLHPVGGKQAPLSMEELLKTAAQPAFRALVDRAEGAGLSVEYEMHAARYLLPADAFAAHPEWFRMNAQGERTADYNFCASNPEALAFASQRLRRAARILAPASHRYFFWLDDAKDSVCHCEKCRALSASDQQLRILNAFLKALREVDSEAKLAYLAYFDAVEPPVRIKPEAGIFLEFAPFERERYACIGDPASELNARQIQTLPRLMALFGMKDAKVLDYWLDNSMYSGWTKPPKLFVPASDIITKDEAYYSRLGFEELSTFACYLGPDYRRLYGEPDLGSF